MPLSAAEAVDDFREIASTAVLQNVDMGRVKPIESHGRERVPPLSPSRPKQDL